MNKIQYISITHTSKVEAKENKKKANTFHTVFLKEDATFAEIADLLVKGSTIGRVGNTTEFLAIDVDDTSVNISAVQAHFKSNPDYRVSFSSSNSPLRYHILVNTHRTITRDDYKAEVEKEFDNIKAQLCSHKYDFMELDKKANNFYQPFFGSSVEISEEIFLEGSGRLWSWAKKDTSPRFYIDREIKVYPSLNSAEYCMRNKLLTIKEEKRFDIHTPHMTNGRWKKIAEGHRSNWGLMIGAKLLMRILYLNHDFNEGWTKNDLLDTFEWIIRKNVVRFDTFKSEFKGLSRFLDNRWVILSNMSYEAQLQDLAPYFDCSKRQYKSRRYNPQVMGDLIQEHKIDDENVLFTSKEDLKCICKELLLNYYEFEKYVTSLGLKVVFEEVVKDKRQKHFVAGMTLEELDQYCKVNGISKRMKWKLKQKI